MGKLAVKLDLQEYYRQKLVAEMRTRWPDKDRVFYYLDQIEGLEKEIQVVRSRQEAAKPKARLT
jgi:hypothetical protein